MAVPPLLHWYLGGGLPRTLAYTAGDNTATPTLAPSSRFAETANAMWGKSR